MCPACLATAAWIAAAAVSTGGIATLTIKKFATSKAVNTISTNTPTKEDRHG
jgi:hypothetical protein